MTWLLLWLGMNAAALLMPGFATALAQPGGVENRILEVLRYTGLEHPPPGDVAQMAEAWAAAQDPGTTPEQRTVAFGKLFSLYAKLQGQEVAASAVEGIARFAASAFEGGARMDLSLPEPRGKPSGSYLHVETRGNGPATLLLISDLGVDGRKLYDSFVNRNMKNYTMHIVTLPLAGAARPLPWPEKLDYAERAWLKQIERELAALLDRPKFPRVTVVGTSAGGYFAARLALLRPQRVRAVVVVDALVAMPMRARNAPDAPAALAERLARIRAAAPPQFFPVAPVPPADELRRLIADPHSTHPLARNWMAFAVKDLRLSQDWSFEALSGGFFLSSVEYQREMATTDLTEDLKQLTVPMLALGAIHDEGSPRQSPPTVSQWDEIKLLYASIPLTVVAFEDTRAYISEDAPEEFDRALADFLAGRPVRGKSGYTLPRTSPRAMVMQAVGGTDVRITYGSPAVKERKIWGPVVRYGRVWRAGANEATSISFSQGVRVEGRSLPAGTYSFFVIPNEGEWTVIFNRVARQWGAFNYNPAFDALRFAVKPEESAHQEHLHYAIHAAGSQAARITLSWERRRIGFAIEASPLPTPSSRGKP